MIDDLKGFETWFFGGLISILLGLLMYFAKNAWDELRGLVKKQGEDITDLKQLTAIHDHRLEDVDESIKRGNDAYERLITTLGALGSRLK